MSTFANIDNKKSGEIERDRWGRYRLYDPEDPGQSVKSWTRVTTFAKAVDDQSNLIKWSNRMVAKGLVTDEALIIKVEDTDLGDRKTLDRLCEAAKEKAGGNQAADFGTALHTLTEKEDRGEKGFRVPAKWKKHLDGYRRIKETSGLEFPPEYIERVVVVPELGVAGTFDRLCRVKEDMTIQIGKKTFHLSKGEYVIGDVKSNKSLSYAQLSISVQLSTYSRAGHVWNIDSETWSPLPEINKSVGFVFHIPSDTGEAQLHAIDLDRGWQAAQLCKMVRDVRGWKDLVSVVDFPENENPFGDDGESVDWVTMIDNASSRQELSLIWRQATVAGEWTSDLEARGKKRMSLL